MAKTLTTKVNIGIIADLLNSVGLASVAAHIETGGVNTYQTGIGANQMDLVFSESAKSISGNYDVDLAGVLLDVFGAVVTFARVKLIAVFADPTNSGNVIMGNAAANAFFGPFGLATHTTNIRPGGSAILFAPDATAWPVTAATADILRFAPSAGTQLFSWVIAGASA